MGHYADLIVLSGLAVAFNLLALALWAKRRRSAKATPTHPPIQAELPFSQAPPSQAERRSGADRRETAAAH